MKVTAVLFPLLGYRTYRGRQLREILNKRRQKPTLPMKRFVSLSVLGCGRFMSEAMLSFG
jgi:hypothetical protein